MFAGTTCQSFTPAEYRPCRTGRSSRDLTSDSTSGKLIDVYTDSQDVYDLILAIASRQAH